MTTRITLTVTSSDEQVIARATEHLARTATGLALDGVEAVIMVGPEEDGDGHDGS